MGDERKGRGKVAKRGQVVGGPDAAAARNRLLRQRAFIWILFLTILAIWFLRPAVTDESPTEIPYTTFRTLVTDGEVERVTVQGAEIRAELRSEVEVPVPTGESPVSTDLVTTRLPSFGDDRLLELLEAAEVEVRAEAESDFSWWLILVYLLPVALIVLLVLFLMRGMQSQGRQMMSIGESRARAFEKTTESTNFSDVAGQDGAKRELEELVAFLKSPEKFERLGGEIPRGFLLVGPPGTGKTLLARAVAGEAEVPFFHISGSDFMEMLVGVGAARVRNLFKDAKEAAPSIIFIDELDSVGRKRGAGLGGGHDEREQTLNQLLSEMDGFEPNSGVVVVAATNRPDILDPAILRPGRFDRRVTVDLPSRSDREAILQIHARRKPLDPEVDLGEVAGGTPGFSGADLKNLLNESALLAARKNLDRIGPREVEEARDKILMGLEREGMALTEEDRRLLAYHEGGHAVLASLLPEADRLHKVSIVPRGRAMGVTQQLPDRDRYLYSSDYLEARLVILLGGRAAEELVLETRTSGAEDDLRQASQLARKMVLSWGMSERFGRVAVAGRGEQVFLGEEIAQRKEMSDATAREVDEEVRAIVERAFRHAVSLLEENRDGLDRVAETLLERDEISGSEVEKLLRSGRELPPFGVTTVDHTADVAIEVEAPELATLFQRAAFGALWLAAGPEADGTDGSGEEPETREVDLEAEDLPALLRSWVREFLYWQEVDGFQATEIEILELVPERVRASVRGGRAPASPEREIKGVTWHGLQVEERNGGWFAQVIFDV
jgi:cell division protease FtsH